jgi:hypothetical protein
VFPDVTVALAGETETLISVVLAVTATEALAFLVGSAALVAVTVTVVLVLTVGAVKSPPLVIEPALANQVTAVLVVPKTAAENCCAPPDATVALVGEILTLTLVLDPAEMTICAWSFALAPCESATFTQKYFVADAAGVPVTSPVVPFRLRPVGKAPSTTRKL